MNSTVEGALPHAEEPESLHGGRGGWFRVACGFSALAAIVESYVAWSVARPPVATTVSHPSWLAGALAVGALCFACASFLAIRRRRSAALLLILGYAIHAVALHVWQDVFVGPDFLLIASMLALMVATHRRRDRLPGLIDR